MQRKYKPLELASLVTSVPTYNIFIARMGNRIESPSYYNFKYGCKFIKSTFELVIRPPD